MNPRTPVPRSRRGTTDHRTRSRCATTAAVMVLAATTGAGTAAAAPPPTPRTPPALTVLPHDQNQPHWDADWTDGRHTCALFINGKRKAGYVDAEGFENLSPNDPLLHDGGNPVHVICDGQRSNTVWLYTPRNEENDVRTRFSSWTQGAFGS